MARQPKVSEQLWRKTNKKGAVGQALTKAAERTTARATAISRANGGKATYHTRDIIRPGGRRAIDVVSSDAAEERGTEEVRRINALRRAARGELP